jgi:hypothetical protein
LRREEEAQLDQEQGAEEPGAEEPEDPSYKLEDEAGRN